MFLFHRKKQSHTADYVALSITLLLCTIAIWHFRFSSITIQFISVFISGFYVFWGVTHHKKHGHIDKKIFLEYFGLALLSLVIIFSLVR